MLLRRGVGQGVGRGIGHRICWLMAVGILLLAVDAVAAEPVLESATQTTTQSASDHADRIFVNGRVWTAVDGHPPAQAFAVHGDRILAVGTNTEMRALIGPYTSVVDLKGHLVVPGFNDAHWHFSSTERADLTDVADVTELQARLLAFGEAHAKSLWIVGQGWSYGAFPDRLPHKKYLDAVFPDRPVVIWDRDGHMCLANSRAMALAGVTREIRDVENGRVERDAAGELTGEFKGAAAELIASHIPLTSNDDRYDLLKKNLAQAAEFGITSLQNVSPGMEPGDEAALERILAAGELKTRFYVAVELKKNPSTEELLGARGLLERFRGPILKFGAAKAMLDGKVATRTSLFFDPYVGGGNGASNWTQEELNHSVTLYDKEGIQVMLHAVGDRAIHMALDAYEFAAKTNGTTGRRPRIERAEVPLPADLPRFRQLGVIASTQALSANPDENTLNNFAVLLGPERAARADDFKQFDDAGVNQAFGSDYPVFSMEILRAIYCAVTRKTAQGTPPEGWYPANRISVEAALQHFTRDGAYASFEDNVKGTITPGKLADFVVLADDILSGPPEKLLQTKVLLTVMGGQPTYQSPDFE